MEGTVTLDIQEYNELYVKAVQGQELERENAELRKRLDNTVTMGDKYIGPTDGSKLRSDTNKVTLDATEVYQVIRQAFDKVKEEENVKSVKDLLAENEMLHKMGVFKHYAKGGVTTKEEATELKRSKMKQRRIIK